MNERRGNPTRRLVEYDGLRRRLWIFGQRCHHGATGSLVAAIAFLGLLAEPAAGEPVLDMPMAIALVAAGGMLMAHDWKDHSIWFERGYGSQP
ncbi:MAG: hypothetical protein ACJ762_00595 [Solirubrobacteraceae bacterium]